MHTTTREYSTGRMPRNNEQGDDTMEHHPPPAIAAHPPNHHHRSTPTSSWTCANCQSLISSERCPNCHCPQVRVLVDPSSEKYNPKDAWLQRVSPSLWARASPLPPPNGGTVNVSNVSGSAAVMTTPPPVPEDQAVFRPLDPVACVLLSAPSPIEQTILPDVEERLRKRPHQGLRTSSSSASATTTEPTSPALPNKKLLSAV